jgi:hypothetical protein
MTDPRAVKIAMRLLQLGVSGTGVTELLSQYPYDDIERQLDYLPHRKAKRPEAFIIEAVRNDYSPPNPRAHASSQTPPPRSSRRLDQNPQFSPGPADAELEGHGTPGAVDCSAADHRLEPGGNGCDLVIPPVNGEDRAA